jgi:hypothetical protein
LRRVLAAIALFVVACLLLGSCGNNYSGGSGGGGTGGNTSGVPFRVFVSNPLFPSGTGNAPVLNIVNAATDHLVPAVVSLGGTISNPGLMAVTPDKTKTLVFSSAENRIAVIGNASEASAGSINLPGATKSMATAPDNITAYVAVPTAPVAGPSPGAVSVLDVSNGKIKSTIPVPNAQAVVMSQKGGFVLAFGDASNATVITTANVGINAPAVNTVGGLDHPVYALFSPDDTKAYVLECGAECGGTTAAVTVVDLTTMTAGTRIPVPAATVGFLDGTTIFVVGTPPGTSCSGTAATSCGELTAISTQSLTVNGASVLVSDGYHDRMVLTGDGQLYIGANHCTNINNPASGGSPGEVRGCLSIFNTTDGTVTMPPDNGDVTGIQSIVSRKVVYVVEGNQVRVYSTTTNTLQTTQVDIVGPAVDVKLVD